MTDRGYSEGGSHKPTNAAYMNHAETGDFPASPGGIVLQGLATVALKVGDIVHLDTVLDSWTKDVTPANYATLTGVVIGGQLTFDSAVQTDSAIGVLPAAGVGQRVLVMVGGVAKVLSDVALVTRGTKITGGSVTAGRASTTGVAAGNYVGVTLDTAAAAGGVIRIAVGWGAR
jgi:hypothetical protein